MPSISVRSFVFLGLLLSLTFASLSSANDKGVQLRQVMADIALLSGQMNQRKADAETIRDQLASQLKTITSEVRKLIREAGINNQAEALAHPRIYHDLMLMAEMRAYIDRYSRKIGYYRVAGDRLGYLYQQADDDLKIVNTLSDLKIGALVSQTQKILDGYLADAQTLVIHPQRITIAPPEKVWRRLTGTP